METFDNVERLCPECLSTDAAFPLVPNCKSCAEMLAHDEWVFWNTPVYMESGHRNGDVVRVSVTPTVIMDRCRQPWKAFFDLITLS